MADLEIIQVPPPKNTKKNKNDPRLPDIEKGSMGFILGPVRSGKSTIIANLLMNKKFFKKQFDLIYLISPTVYYDDTIRHVRELDNILLFDKYDDSIVEALIEAQGENPKDEKQRICLILDDMVGYGRSSNVFNLGTRYRHYGIKLLLYSTQLYKSLPNAVRDNFDFAIFLGIQHNDNEILKIVDELSGIFSSAQEFEKIFRDCTSERHQFLYLNTTFNPPRVYKNFTQRLK